MASNRHNTVCLVCGQTTGNMGRLCERHARAFDRQNAEDATTAGMLIWMSAQRAKAIRHAQVGALSDVGEVVRRYFCDGDSTRCACRAHAAIRALDAATAPPVKGKGG